MQIENKGINSSIKEGETKLRISLKNKCTKKGYDIGQFQMSGEFSLQFWNLADSGVEIDYLKLQHWQVETMAFKTQYEIVTRPPPPPHLTPLKKHPSTG